MLEWGVVARCYMEQTSLCVCLCESEADFSPHTLEGCLRSGWQQMLMFVLACSVGVWCLLSVCCMTKVLMRWVVQAAAHCEGDPKASGASELCSGCRLYPSQSHLQLERSQVREKETATEEERKRDKAIETERGGQGVYLHLGDGFTVE